MALECHPSPKDAHCKSSPSAGIQMHTVGNTRLCVVLLVFWVSNEFPYGWKMSSRVSMRNRPGLFLFFKQDCNSEVRLSCFFVSSLCIWDWNHMIDISGLQIRSTSTPCPPWPIDWDCCVPVASYRCPGKPALTHDLLLVTLECGSRL